MLTDVYVGVEAARFGFTKVLLLHTGADKLFALHSDTGEVLWAARAPGRGARLFVTRRRAVVTASSNVFFLRQSPAWVGRNPGWWLHEAPWAGVTSCLRRRRAVVRASSKVFFLHQSQQCDSKLPGNEQILSIS